MHGDIDYQDTAKRILIWIYPWLFASKNYTTEALHDCQEGKGTINSKLDNVFPPNDLWFGSDTEQEFCCYV